MKNNYSFQPGCWYKTPKNDICLCIKFTGFTDRYNTVFFFWPDEQDICEYFCDQNTWMFFSKLDY